MALLHQNFAHFVFFGAAHAHFVPIVCGVAACGVRLAQSLHFCANVFAKALQIIAGEHAFHFDVIDLLDIVPALEQVRGEVAIIGEEHQAGIGIFEIANGVNAFGKSAQQIAQRFAALWIGERGNNFRRLVKQQINFAAFGGNFFTGDFNFVRVGVGFGAEFADDFSVYFYLAADDELLGVSAGRDAG